MSTQRITDDLVRLLELLPDGVQRQLASDESREALLEVVLDLGRVPEARLSAPNRPRRATTPSRSSRVIG